MRQLRYLTSFSLHILLEPWAARSSDRHLRYSDDGDDGDDSIPEDILEKQNCWGSSYEEIWKAISNADLRLQEITVYDIPSSFVGYISSYSAKKFYEALEMHAGSIEVLDVNAYYEGLWCFGHHNQSSVFNFPESEDAY